MGTKTKRPAPEVIGELPAGCYYIGDPCYLIRDDDAWMAFLADYEKAGGYEKDAVIFEHKGKKAFVSRTNTGDGCYSDQHGNSYPVDAGMIAAVCNSRGTNFTHDFSVAADPGRWLDKGKRIRIGHIIIRT